MAQISAAECGDGPEFKDMSFQELERELHRLQAYAARYYPNRHLENQKDNYFDIMNDTLMNYLMCLYQIRDCPRFQKNPKKCPNRWELSVALYPNVGNHNDDKVIPYGCFDKHDNDEWTRRYFVDGDNKTAKAFNKRIHYTMIEKMWHPSVWKTQECEEYKKYGVCNWGLICWYYHTEKDKRQASANVPEITQSSKDLINWQMKPPAEYTDWIDTMYDIDNIKREMGTRPVCLLVITNLIVKINL